ncbi:MAG TPA: hypothetical protein VIL74_20815 [Pyrinomonadaceae bacterium]|jgi:hypothetical protein
MDLVNFVKERDEALRSLDEIKIREYAIKYRVPLPQNIQVFWAAVHKARLASNGITEQEKQISREWLTQNGFQPEFLGVN